MYKLIALYKKPDDIEAFDAHYTDVHIPLVRRIPGLSNVTVNRCTGTPMGGEADYFMIVEMAFPDEDTFRQAMASKENIACGKDIKTFARGLVTLVTAVS
jgi:uncharacterized protein (TIGR02118 family)